MIHGTRSVVLASLFVWSAGTASVTAGQLTAGDGAPLEKMFPTRQLQCRGAQDGMRIDAPDLTPDERAVISPTNDKRAGVRTLFLYFLPSAETPTADHKIEEGTCTLTERTLFESDPNAVVFDTTGSAQVFQKFFDDPDHVFTFPVRNMGYGSFMAVRVIDPSELVSQRTLVADTPVITSPGVTESRQKNSANANEIHQSEPGQPVDTSKSAPTPQAPPPKDAPIATAGPIVKNPAASDAVNPDPVPRKNAPIETADRITGSFGAGVAMNPQPLPPKESPIGPVAAVDSPSVKASASRRPPAQVPSATRTESSAASPSPTLERIGRSVGDRRTEATQIDCTRGPIAGALQGRIMPGEHFTIAGACFGSLPGTVELIGQFKGRTLKLDFSTWNDTEIVAATPQVTGIPDQVVSLTVIRPDGKRSATKQASFVAAKERVEVPVDFWSPSSHYKWHNVQEGGFDYVSDNVGGRRVGGFGKRPDPATFRLRVNPACSLDNMEATPTVGAVTDIVGWENGPSYDARVTIVWQPHQKFTNKTFPGGDKQVYESDVEFDLKAWALCPIGIKP